MVGTITLGDYTGFYIRVTGGSSAAPVTFEDIYLADVAGDWGQVIKLGDSTYAFACRLVIGESTGTSTYFKDTNKCIIWLAGGINTHSYAIYVYTGSVFMLGESVDDATKNTRNGVTLINEDPTVGYDVNLIQTEVTNTVYLYSSTIVCEIGTNLCRIYGATRIWNCIFLGNRNYIRGANLKADMYNVTFCGCLTAGYQNPSTSVMDKILIYNCGYVGTYMENGNVLKNATFLNENKTCYIWGSSGSGYYVNCVSYKWAMFWASGTTMKLYRQYEFDLTTDPSATVTLKNNSGATVFSVAADAVTGAIATQTVSRGYYQRSTGDTLQDYGPFTLAIAKAGKMPYTQTGIVLAEKTKWQITLRDQLTGDAEVGDVIAGKKFYKDDADAQLVGSLSLTGNATAADVAKDKTFYGTDPKTKLTGAHLNPAVFVDVLSGKPVINLKRADPNNKAVLPV
jgi:hypothetical protein